ncbi:hypothetical protein DZK27_17070 [Rhodobacteraceae bacterium 63075]|nr:hypothetical protein DZK27_17070 [Rhodobacteraceae bacterium 63075]
MPSGTPTGSIGLSGSYAQIADCLNSSGVTTARGSQWHPTSVRRTLERF